ncbi:hypothetical protein B0T16DRAFT_454935 [Cercophora newfieldiana]|uniref:BZIP domain-containing protein n=1 Tax=Cercophora newfieldiana TaxID=92897 RepID=A0AA40CV49_9PEZI|nr:hypothetical protein B0T16DRAFT_454935 [Cercophora newfieldiana]
MPGSENETDDVELTQRRERGRRAQRAFRRRQIDTIRELREDNQALREAIDEISRAAAAGPAHARGRQSNLQVAIQNAFRVAGLDASVARSLGDLGDDDDSDPSLNTPGLQQQQQQGLVGGGSIDPALEFMSLGAPLLLTTAASSANIYTQLAASAPPPYYQTPSEASSGGRMSPRLTYGLWVEPDRAIRIVQPPHDIVPYVGEGMRSLAGTIFWTGMGFSLGAFRTIIDARYRGMVLGPDASSSSDDCDFAGDDSDYADDDTDDALLLSVFRHAHPKRRQLLHNHAVVVAGGPDDDILDEPPVEDDDDPIPPLPAQHDYGRTANQPFSAPRGPQATSQRPSPPQQTPPHPHPHPSQKNQKRYRRRVRRAYRIIQRMFGPTTRHTSDQTVYDIIHARFTWRTKGWIAGDHPGRDPDGPMRLFAAILQEADHPAAYGEAHLWMTPLEIEAYVQSRLRMTPAGWTPWEEALKGRGDARRIQMVNRLVDLFVLHGMCFGDGPRWRADKVARWTEQWIEQIAVGPAGVGLWF